MPPARRSLRPSSCSPPTDSGRRPSPTTPMLIQRLLQLMLGAIVLLVAFALLAFLFKVGLVLLGLGLRVLVILLVVAAVLRFIELLRQRRRR